jgi:predicted nuclease of predicted toxin-antitoxin system
VINLYLDENVNILLATLLRARSINVITTRESDMLGTGDEEQLEYAVNQKTAIVTHNRVDFEYLYSLHYSPRNLVVGKVLQESVCDDWFFSRRQP